MHFFTLTVPGAQYIAAEFLKRGICVHNCTPFRPLQLVRIAMRTPDENRILIRVWRDGYGP